MTERTRWQKALDDFGRYPLPAPPADGGFIVLNEAQISDWDLVCGFRLMYPHIKLIAQKPLPKMERKGGRQRADRGRR